MGSYEAKRVPIRDLEAANTTLDTHVPGWYAENCVVYAPNPSDGVIYQIGSNRYSDGGAMVNAAEFVNHRLTDEGSVWGEKEV
jgi:hypothetical protein